MLRLLLGLAAFALVADTAPAAIIVVANRTPSAVDFQLATKVKDARATRTISLAAGDSQPVWLSAPAQLAFASTSATKSYRVVPGGMYWFGQTATGQVDLNEIGLSTPTGEGAANDNPTNKSAKTFSSTAEPRRVVVPVKIVCDQFETASSDAWEHRIRARFDEASRILARHCFVEFRVVAVERWRSDPNLIDLEQSLAEFEHAVDPAPARLAIGFSGQKRRDVQYRRLGGTRGALHTHLLIRERLNQNFEAERLEVLVHELGHFLGASHSPEPTSVMRAVLGDRQARAAGFRIGFDPLNTLAMCLVSEELRQRPLGRLSELPAATQAQLRRIYIELARAAPQDPTALTFLCGLQDPLAGAAATAPRPTPPHDQP